MLIGITGKARSGKDSAARHLFERYAFTRVAFADPLKLAAQSAFGLTMEQTFLDAYKDQRNEYWGMTHREIFQKMGVGLRDLFGPEIWIKRWFLPYRLLAKTDDIVVPDVRFDDEADVIRSLGGTIVHLARPNLISPLSSCAQAHVSEDGITTRDTDALIINNGTLDELLEEVDKLIIKLRGRTH